MLTYFLQVNLCWLLFYGLYYVLLSRETFFTLNRIYLIISLLAGLILPFAANWLQTETPLMMPLVDSIMLPTFVVGMQEQVEDIILPLNTEGGHAWTLWTIISSVYFIGVGIMSLRFLLGLYRIFTTFKTANFYKKDGIYVAYTDDTSRGNREGITQPFSFFNFIFINDRTLQNIDFQNIMQHEKAHVKQGHSFDVVFLELINIAFWFSPLIYLYKNSLRIVHEYLADAAVLRAVSKKQYGTLLIQQSQSGRAMALANPFFSQLKKRIIMMTRNPSKRQALGKYVFALPIFLLLVSFLATPNNAAMKATENVSDEMASKMSDLDEKFQDFNNKELIENDSVKRKVPNVFVSINGKKGDLSVEEVRNLNKFFVNYSEYSNPMGEDIGEITSFFVELTIRKKVKGETVETTQIAESNDGKFTDEILSLFKNAEDGYRYHFKNVIFKMKKEPYLSWNVGEIYIAAVAKEKLERWKNLPIQASLMGRKDIKIVLFGKYSGEISIEEFKKATELHFGQKDFDYSSSINGDAMYQITRASKNGDVFQSTEKSVQFSDSGLKLIQQAQEGDTYHFNKINFTAKFDKKAIEVPNITFYIKKNDISDEKPFVCLPLGASTPVTGGEIKLGIFQNIDGLMLKNNPKKEYRISQFHIYKIAKLGLVSKVILNEGNALQGEARTLVEKADYGDAFYFKDVMVSKNFPKKLENYGTLHFTVGDYSKNPDLPVPRDTTLPILTQVDEFPHFQGGQDTMFKWLSKNIRYPVAARERRVEGTVYVGFVVETDGSISNVTIKHEPFYPKDTLKILETNGMQGFKLVNSRAEGSLGREAKRVVAAMPTWTAGRKKGQAVRVAYTLPIKFKLE